MALSRMVWMDCQGKIHDTEREADDATYVAECCQLAYSRHYIPDEERVVNVCTLVVDLDFIDLVVDHACKHGLVSGCMGIPAAAREEYKRTHGTPPEEQPK